MNHNGFMNYPLFGLRLRPFEVSAQGSLEQGVQHRVETCMKANSFLAGADSRIPRIRELCRLGMLVCRDVRIAIFVGSSEV